MLLSSVRGIRPGEQFERSAYRQRNKVKRLINRLKQHPAIATRYEKLAATATRS
ncbi:MAG: Transposase domain [Thermomicrobiales bacterium]|jgi:transposase|nr:Transposase domain [Thermomicrobiales bacterium]MEA2528226.1 Transposase domain [Thermomicrobiales bacterium]